MEFLRQLWNGTLQAWRQLSLSARVNISLAGILVLAVLGFIVVSGVRPQYVTLSADLEPRQASEVTQLLAQQGVSYRLSNDGKTVEVPMAERSRALLLLADNNLPVGRRLTAGLEGIQQGDLMSSRWLQDVKFMQAIQGEIERHLNALDFVEYSLVLIREARRELFLNEQRPSEAAVTLKVRRMPTKEEVRGMVNLVAAAGGENLSPNNITINTTDGVSLHAPPASAYMAVANSRLEHVAELERRAEGRIKEAMADLGKKAMVRVSAKVNFEERTTESETFTDGAEVSSMKTTTTSESEERLPEGPPGAFANPPEGGANASGVATTEKTTESITNSEPSVMRTKTKVEPGDVIKYTVALVVEGDRTSAAGAAGEQYSPLTEAEKETYKNIVLGVVGQSQEPSVVTVDDHPFDIRRFATVETAIAERAASERWSRMQSMGWTGAQVLLILVGFFVVRALLRRAIEVPRAEVEEEDVREIPEATREDLRRQQVQNEIAGLAVEEPEAVALLLRSWMVEEED